VREHAGSGSSSHLQLSLQRWQLLLDVCQCSGQSQLLALKVVDLALSSLSSLKKPLALLLHTSPPITINKNIHSLVCHREDVSCSQSNTLHFAKSAYFALHEHSSKQTQCSELDMSTPHSVSCKSGSRREHRHNASKRRQTQT